MHRIIDAVRQAGRMRGRFAVVVLALLAAALAPAAASAAPQTLTVKKAGTGTGTVSSVPAGISCGETCAAPFAEGEKVVLTGVPGVNTAAVKWSGCTELNLENECKVTIGSEAKTVTATFNLLERSLTVEKKGAGTGTVTSSPAGISCGGTCSAGFVKDSAVVLTGAPGAETLAPKWEGCDSVDGENKCHVTMSIARTVTVTFDLSEYQITVEKKGAGTGTVTSSPAGISCGGTCSAGFETGSLVTLSGSPGENTDPAVQWSGCDSVNGEGKCLVTVSAARSVTATFNLVQRQLKVAKTGAGTGTVTSSPAGVSCGGTCQASFAHGTLVTLTGVAGLHSEAVEWSGCESEEGGKCLVTMSAAKEVSARFDLEPGYAKYTVTVRVKGTGQGSVSSAPGGIQCPEDCSEDYLVKTSLTLVATPAAGSEFAHWSVKACGTSTVCPRTVKGTRTINAVFKAVGTRTLTVAKAGTGSGAVTSMPAGIECGSTCSGEFAAATKVVLRATAAVGSTFSGWSGAGCSGAKNCRVTMNEARGVTATFAREPGPVVPGVLSVRSPIVVKGRKALLQLSCHNGPCRGVLRLIARVRTRKGRKSRARNVEIGRMSIKLNAGVSSKRRMRLSKTGISLLRKRGSLKVRVTGGGTLPHRVKLSLRRR